MKQHWAKLLFMAGFFVGSAWAQPEAKISYYHTDHLGSVRMVTDAQRAIRRTSDYLPFREGIVVTENKQLKFTGHSRDGETTEDYFGARYYASPFGRFTSPDLIFADHQPDQPQSWNLYGYVRNNPLRYKDPDGRATVADDAKRIIQTL